MRRRMLVLLVTLSLVTVSLANVFASEKAASPAARKAASANPSESAASIAALRAAGQTGLDDFLEAFAAELKTRESEINSNTLPPSNPEWQLIGAALDQVCQQRDCYASRLFWYTDLAAARAAAKLSGKPILSLRLLGRLDEELSCANSRFFRLILYANSEVSRLLRERFILHWESVRPVPRVTIDFGDGRKLERTLTGNSIHYVLDSEGRPIDALPGLYGPGAFLRELSRAERVAIECEGKNSQERDQILRQYHNERLVELATSWTTDISRARIASPPSREPMNADLQSSDSPRAEVAARIAVSKLGAERPVLRGISSDPKLLKSSTEDAAWVQIATLHTSDARLDNGSKLLVRAKNPALYGGVDPASRAAFERTIAGLERSVALDTVRNEFVLHTRIHEWFANGGVPADLVVLNGRVYAELFLTPGSDPWLGLFPKDGYSGIENDGVKK